MGCLGVRTGELCRGSQNGTVLVMTTYFSLATEVDTSHCTFSQENAFLKSSYINKLTNPFSLFLLSNKTESFIDVVT